MRRPSAPLVIPVIALFAALGGTSYAAAKITGKEIAKKTIKGGNVANQTLSAKKLKPDTLTGNQIDEATLGVVANATAAANADTLDGLDSTNFMRSGERAFEADRGTVSNFGSGAPLVTLTDLAAGTYVVTAKLTYDNDGASAAESCTLDVPGTNDTTNFVVSDTEAITLQEVVTSASLFSAHISCTGDGNDDTYGNSSLIAMRLN
jgi:hypothetical protein